MSSVINLPVLQSANDGGDEARHRAARLRQLAESTISRLAVSKAEVTMTWAILLLILAVDISFAYEQFRLLYQDPYGQQTTFQIFWTACKALMPLGLTVVVKLLLDEIATAAIGQEWWRTGKASSRAMSVWHGVRWAIMVLGAFGALYLLAVYGQVAFTQMAARMAEVEAADIKIDLLNGPLSLVDEDAPATGGAAALMEAMWPVFLVTSLAAAMAWSRISMFGKRRKACAEEQAKVDRCDQADAFAAQAVSIEKDLRAFATPAMLDQITALPQVEVKHIWYQALSRLQDIVNTQPLGATAPLHLVNPRRACIEETPLLADPEGYRSRIEEAIQAVERLTLYTARIQDLLPAHMIDDNGEVTL